MQSIEPCAGYNSGMCKLIPIVNSGTFFFLVFFLYWVAKAAMMGGRAVGRSPRAGKLAFAMYRYRYI